MDEQGTRLESWKEIAAYLKRDIRTARRWEKLEGLPVHRHLHDSRGTAYAYTGEIDEWLETRTVNDPVLEPRSGSNARLLWGIACTAAIVAAIALFAALRPRPGASSRVSSLSIVLGPSQYVRQWGPDMAVSPDGNTVAYIARDGTGVWHVYVRRLDELSGRPREGASGSVYSPFFSPDGRWIGFFQEGRLMKMAAAGGAPVPINDRTIGFMGSADWAADDSIVYADVDADGRHTLFRTPVAGSSPHAISTLDAHADEAYWLTPQAVPGSDLILSTVARRTPTGSHFAAVAVSASSGERHALIDNAKHAVYIGDGVVVYGRGDSLFAARLDVKRAAIAGPHVPAWDGVFAQRIRMRAWAHGGGTLVYWPNVHAGHRLAWVDRHGRIELLAAPAATYNAPRLAPDGRSIATIIGGEFGDVWRYDLDKGATAQLTFDGRTSALIWTPDGSQLTTASSHGAVTDILQLPADGASVPESLVASSVSKWPSSWSPDGRTLAYVQGQPTSNTGLWTLDAQRQRHSLLEAPALRGGRFSPDGRFIAFSSRQSGRPEIFVTPFPEGRPKWQVSNDGGLQPVWARSGRELFYRNGERMMAVPVALSPAFTPGAPRVLFEGKFYDVEPGDPSYDISLDDQRFLMILPAGIEGPDRLNVIQGWKAAIVERLRDQK